MRALGTCVSVNPTAIEPFGSTVPGMSKLGDIAKRLRTELKVYRCIARHPDTPRSAKFLLGLALGYLCLPFDLIPDWLPVIGCLDDAVIVPFLVWLALRLIPKHVVRSCRERHLQPEAPNESAGIR